MHRIVTKYFTFLLALLFINFFPQVSHAQENDKEQAITKAINKLFDGMRDGDSTAVRSVFMPECTMYSAFRTSDFKSMMRAGDIESFVTAVGTPHEKVWDEKISNLIIHVDDNIATAWMDYHFYVGETFSHCGTNVMQFFLSDNEWKIIHLMDTRKKECE